jgi:cytochrome c-type biogenesis protein
VSFFAPCIVPLLPVYVSVLSGNSDGRDDTAKPSRKFGFALDRKLIFQTLVFVMGLGTTFVMLGFGAGVLGSFLSSHIFRVICGGVVIILGLHQTGIFRLLILDQERKLSIDQNHSSGTLKSYILGLTFSFGWTPCVGPVLAAVIGLASNSNQLFYGVLLMIVYTLGLSIPFLLIAFFTDNLLRIFKKMNRHLPKVRIIGGILVIFMGIRLNDRQFEYNQYVFYQNLGIPN